MVANVGFFTLVVTFVVALYGAGAAAFGSLRRQPAWIESARHAMLLTWPLLTVASVCLISLLVTGAYEVEYVASTTSNAMPVYLKITAWWGGQAGSLLFWSWLMAGFATVASLRNWDRDREFLPWVIVVTMVTLAFFLSLTVFFENPFVRLWMTSAGEQAGAMFQPAGAVALTPADGRGLNPLLRHPGMVIHPPMLYLGFVSFVIPFAFAMAALITRRTDDRWIRITRRWTLVAWLFLSLGLILGGRWAYDVLGWGGYWGWDPVENAAFMPWLTGTAFLHSVIDPGKARHAQALEHGAHHPDLLAGDLRHVPDALGRALLRAFVRPVRHRADVLRLHRADVRRLALDPDQPLGRSEGREPARLDVLARSALHAEQPAVHGHPGGLFLGGDLPADLGDLHRSEGDRGADVL